MRWEAGWIRSVTASRSPGICFVATALLAVVLLVLTASPAQAQLQESPWPTFGRDKGRTGQSPYLGAQTGELKWTLGLGNMVGSPVIADDGTVYVVSSDELGGRKQLHAIDSAGGTIRWSYPPTFPPGPTLGVASTPTIGRDGTIYLTIEMGEQLIAVNPDGTLKWSRWVHPAPYNSPAVGDDGTIYAGSFFAVNPDGSEKWRRDYGWWHGTPAIAPATTAFGPAGSIHVGHPVASQQVFSPDGVLISPPGDGPVDGDPAIGAEGAVAVVDQYIYWAWLLYYPPSGSPPWSAAFAASGGHPMRPAIASDGTVYIATGYVQHADADLRAYAPDGTLKWSAIQNGDPQGSKPAIGADGTVYLHTSTGHYALDPADGSIKWQNVFAHHTFGSSPAIGRDGSVIVGGQYSLYAYKGPPRVVDLSLARAIPDRGGNAGQATVVIRGDGIVEGATAKLARSGEADVPGGNVGLRADAAGVGLSATFNLRGKTPGAWDVVVTNPDGRAVSLPGGFIIEPGGQALVWVDIVGRADIRAGREQVYHLLFGNRGNVDGLGYAAIGGIPAGAAWRLDMPPPPAPFTHEGLLTVATVDGETWAHLPTILVPPGTTGSIALWITVAPATVPNMNLRLRWSEP